MKAISAAILIGLAQSSKILTGLVLIKLIAIYLGPEGLGKLGHLISLVAILNLIAGGGIVNGVIKYVSEYRERPRRMLAFVSASAVYSLTVSILILLLLVVLAEPLSRLIFSSTDYQWYFVYLALAQLCFAFAKLVVSVANGLKHTQTFTLIQLGGNMLAIPVIWYLVSEWGFSGAAVSVALVFAILALPALIVYIRSSFSGRISFSLSSFDFFRQLSGFSLMLIVSAITFPVVEMVIRQLIIDNQGYTEAGVWQASVKLSQAYIGFFGLFLAYYFLPRISPEEDKQTIVSETLRYMLVIGVIFTAGALVFWVSRSFFVPLLLSDKFGDLQYLVHLQLIGDFLKILSFVIGFIFVAKAFTWVYISAEIFQHCLFMGLAYVFYSEKSHLESVFHAYVATYVIYLTCMLLALWWFRCSGPDKVQLEVSSGQS